MPCTNLISAKESSYYFHQIDTKVKARYQEFEDIFSQFIQNMDKSLELRHDAYVLFKTLDSKLRNNEPIRANEQRTLLKKFGQFRDDRDKLERLVESYRGYSDESRELKFPESKPSESSLMPGLWGTKKEIMINPDDDLGRLIILEVKMWLAAKLMIIDNYAVIVLRYH